MMYTGAPIKTGAYPSVASIMGSLGSQALMNELNESSGASRFFGSEQDRFAANFNKWTTSIVAPWYQQETKLEIASQTLLRKDVIMSLTSLEDFKYIPPVMQLPILLTPEVMLLLKQGRIDGFGFTFDQLKDVEDVYGRLIDNGLCECVQENLLKDEETGESYILTEEHFWSDDPKFSDEELDKIADTRDFVRSVILAQTNWDPTAIEDERG